MTITTDRLCLRPSGPGFAQALHQGVFAHYAVAQYVSRDGEPLSPEDVEHATTVQAEHWERHGFGIWVLLEPDGDDVLGYCGLRVTPEGTEILYALAPDRWGRGLASEAARATARYAFEVLCLPELVAWVEPTNLASLAVLNRLGMTDVGVTEHEGVTTAALLLRPSRFRWTAGHYDIS